jgi:hypothetical protein
MQGEVPAKAGTSPPQANMTRELDTRCPHCHQPMRRWANPQLGSWSGEYQFVCFNDDCPYFVRGWEWMKSQFNVTASYRYRLEPDTGENGPLPVWSRDALKSSLLSEEVSPNV